MTKRKGGIAPAEDIADLLGLGESLVDLHRGATRVCKHGLHALELQGLHKVLGALARLVAPIRHTRRACPRMQRQARIRIKGLVGGEKNEVYTWVASLLL